MLAMKLPINQIICGDWIEIAKELPAGLVHLICTSPPYWGQRNYGVEGQLGLEKTPEEHIEKLVVGFREFRRVLRDDGLLWINYGDKYVGGGCGGGGKQDTNVGSLDARTAKVKSLGDGNLIGLAWRLAFALQADGWILRSDCIWAKAVSFCDTYSGSTMPESLNGWRWERHKVKVKAGICPRRGDKPALPNSGGQYTGLAQWQDCPGCPKCEPNDGLILRKGSWRPTRAHEDLFLFAKKSSPFSDMEAVREEQSRGTLERAKYKPGAQKKYEINKETGCKPCWSNQSYELPSGRNLRDVWTINPQSYADAHYATFPEKLIEPIIKVSTSQKGCCPKCGAQWARVVDSKQVKRKRPADRTDRHHAGEGINSCGNTVAGVDTTTLGWRPTCKCGVKETVPAIVYDPFMGSGTVAMVAAKLGRNYIGSELNKDYIDNQAQYRATEGDTGVPVAEQKAGQMPLFKEK